MVACFPPLVLVGPPLVSDRVGFSAARLVLVTEFRCAQGQLAARPWGASSSSFAAHAVANFTFSGLRVGRLMAVSFLLMLYRFTKGKGKDDPLQLLMGIFVATSILHFVLASAGWLYRYEAYLVAMGLVAVAAPLYEFVQRFPRTFRMTAGEWAGLAALALTILTTNLLWSAGDNSLRITVRATNNIYIWHYHMGLFVQRYYQGSALTVNDLGAVNFMADIQCTDFHGLADLDVAQAMLLKALRPAIHG